MPFRVVTHGRDPLNLRELLERFANEQWLPDHVDDDRRRRMILDAFKRQLLHDVELLEIDPPDSTTDAEI